MNNLRTENDIILFPFDICAKKNRKVFNDDINDIDFVSNNSEWLKEIGCYR